MRLVNTTNQDFRADQFGLVYRPLDLVHGNRSYDRVGRDGVVLFPEEIFVPHRSMFIPIFTSTNQLRSYYSQQLNLFHALLSIKQPDHTEYRQQQQRHISHRLERLH